MQKAIVELRKEDPESRLVVRDSREAPAPRPHPVPAAASQLTVVDVSRNPARARQCIRLTRSRTVPHVFFNDDYIGVRHAPPAKRRRQPRRAPHTLRETAEFHLGVPPPRLRKAP